MYNIHYSSYSSVVIVRNSLCPSFPLVYIVKVVMRIHNVRTYSIADSVTDTPNNGIMDTSYILSPYICPFLSNTSIGGVGELSQQMDGLSMGRGRGRGRGFVFREPRTVGGHN